MRQPSRHVRTVVLAAALALALSPRAAAAAVPSHKVVSLAAPPPKTVLWVGNSNTFTGSVDRQVARLLQEVAWETVREFYGGGAP